MNINLDPKVQQQIITVVNQLAHSLGIAAQHVYQVVARQIFMEGVVDLTIYSLVLLCVLSILGLFWWVVITDKADKNGDGKITMTFISLGAFIVFLFSICVPRDAALKIANPEYYTMTRIISLAQGKGDN